MAVMAVAAKIRWWHIGHFSEQRGAILSSAEIVIGKQAEVTLDNRFADCKADERA